MTARPALALAALLALGADAAEARFDLAILHINDFHSRLEPINRFDSTCPPEEDARGECFGGVARLKTALEARRAALAAEGFASLTLDAGDQFQGSLFHTVHGGTIVGELLGALGFDAMALGNHEFNAGPRGLAALLDAATFPVLAANIDVSAEPLLAGRIPGSAVIEVGGRRVGVVAAVTTDTPTISNPGPTVAFADEVAALTEASAALAADGVNIVIALTHVGLRRDREIAAQVPGLDAVVGGHSHSLMGAMEGAVAPYPLMVAGPDGSAVPVVQAFAYGKYLGELRLSFDEAGRVTAVGGAPILIDASFQPDPAIAARVAALAEPLAEMRAEVVAEAAAPIGADRADCRARECEMGVLVADAMLAHARPLGAEIAIQNGGGLRAGIDAGPITKGEVLTVLPFQNTLATFGLRGADVVAALEHGVSAIADGAGRFPQVAGLRFTLDAAAPVGARVSGVEVEGPGGWAPIEPERLYGVVSNNFLRRGGDGYAVFRDAAVDPYDFGPNLEEVVIAFLQANSPYAPRLAGRIVLAAAEGPAFDAGPDVDFGEAAPPAPAVERAAAEGPAFDAGPDVDFAEAAPPARAAGTHVVRRGESLWRIARAQWGRGARWPELAAANGLSDPWIIHPGQTLAIPR